MRRKIQGSRDEAERNQGGGAVLLDSVALHHGYDRAVLFYSSFQTGKSCSLKACIKPKLAFELVASS